MANINDIKGFCLEDDIYEAIKQGFSHEEITEWVTEKYKKTSKVVLLYSELRRDAAFYKAKYDPSLTKKPNIIDIKADTIQQGIEIAIRKGFSHKEITEWVISKSQRLPTGLTTDALFPDRPRVSINHRDYKYLRELGQQDMEIKYLKDQLDNEHEEWMDDVVHGNGQKVRIHKAVTEWVNSTHEKRVPDEHVL